jgi:hypothetical protein
MPTLPRLPFETAIIERSRRREASVEKALVEMNLAGVSVRLHVRRIDPQIRPASLDRPILADRAHAHGLHQLVYGARGDALAVRFLDHGGEGYLGRPTRLEQTAEVAPLAQLRRGLPDILEDAENGLPVLARSALRVAGAASRGGHAHQRI